MLSFFVWAHHQFIAGIDPRMANVFTATTVLISIPIAEMMFVFVATLYGGSITLTVPMLWALSFIAEFIIGGVTGIFLGSSGSDIYFHDTYFVLAHFHYTFVPIAVIGVLAGITYWYPKMFGRMYPEGWSKLSAVIIFVGFNLTFFPQFILGYMGLTMRYATSAGTSRGAIAITSDQSGNECLLACCARFQEMSVLTSTA